MQFQRFVGVIFLISQFFVSVAYSNQSHATDTKNILILFAQAPSTPAYRILSDGIRQKLDAEYGEAYNLYSEFLEIERYPKGEYPKERFELYNDKYRSIKLDLLICIGIDAITTVKKCASAQIVSLPAVSIDFDLSDYGIHNDIVLNEKTSVIGLRVNISRTISEALKLFPETTSIYFLCGTSKSDSLFMYVSQKEAEKLKNTKKVVLFSNISMEDALKKVRNMPANSLIILSSFNTDNRNIPYYNYESMRLISKAANVPVFAYTDMGFGSGALGGYFLSFAKVAAFAGETCIKILNGTDPKNIQVKEADYYVQIYDWREMKRWRIENSDLIAEGSEIAFREDEFISKYRWQIVLVLLFVLIETLLIVFLYRANHRQKELMKQKAETENLFRDLMRKERLLRMAELTASLSHELNQPLTAILYSAQAGVRFLETGKLDSAQAKEIFDNIIEDDKRAGSIISSVRSLMKSESKENEVFSLQDLIQETINIYHSEAIRQNIQIRVNQPDKLVRISGDKIQLQQVMLNLFSNASRAMSCTVTAKRIIEIEQQVNHNSVTVSVRDYGHGISADIKDKLFRPFVTTNKNGLGIGLSISRSIIERHGGAIHAENKIGGGAEFSFTLKIV